MDNHLQRNAQQWFDCVKAYLKSELDIKQISKNINEINRGLVKLLKKDGFETMAEAVGSRNPIPEMK